MRLAIDLFILWYLAVMIAGGQSPTRVLRRGLRPFDVLIDGFGLRQHWAMFAPDPTRRSLRLHALIQLSSGGAIRWDPPRFDHSRLAAWIGFRRRLFELMVAGDSGAVARRSLAAYLLRTYHRDDDAAVAVILVSTETSVDPPAEPIERIIARIPVEELDAVAARPR